MCLCGTMLSSVVSKVGHNERTTHRLQILTMLIYSFWLGVNGRAGGNLYDSKGWSPRHRLSSCVVYIPGSPGQRLPIPSLRNRSSPKLQHALHNMSNPLWHRVWPTHNLNLLVLHCHCSTSAAVGAAITPPRAFFLASTLTASFSTLR